MPDFEEESSLSEEESSGTNPLQEGIFMLGVFLAAASVVLLLGPVNQESTSTADMSAVPFEPPVFASEIRIRLLNDNRIVFNGTFIDSKTVAFRIAEVMAYQPDATIYIEASADSSVDELVKVQNAARVAAGADSVIVEMQHSEEDITSLLLR